jgi:tetratricopeptide (TPR) repeat protein
MNKSLQIEPNTEVSYQILASILLAQNKPNEALKAALKEQNIALKYHGLAMVYHDLGDDKKALEFTEKLIEGYEQDYSYQVAGTYAYLGDTDKAYFWLEKALDYKDFGLMELKIEPYFNGIKDDPRWPVFLGRLGFLSE